MNRNDIPGLHTLESVHEATNDFLEKLKQMDISDYPDVNEAELIRKYPVAAALLLAEEWGRSDKPFKAAAGQMTAQQILDGRDHREAIHDMIAAWSKNRT